MVELMNERICEWMESNGIQVTVQKLIEEERNYSEMKRMAHAAVAVRQAPSRQSLSLTACATLFVH